MLVDLQRDERFHIINHKCNLGTSAALNTGHEYIQSEYIAIQGSDDVSTPDRFKRQCDFLERRKDVDVLGAQLMIFWDHDPKRKSIFLSKHGSHPKPGKGWQTNHGTVMYRNQAVKDVGGYDVERRRAQDVWLFKKLMEKGYKFQNLSECLYHWRRIKKVEEPA